jgi:hypothetical protein
MQSMIQLATAFFKMAESLDRSSAEAKQPHTVPQLPRGVVQLRCRRPKPVV